MNPIVLYFIMQIESIGRTIGFLAVAFMVMAVISMICYFVGCTCGYDQESRARYADMKSKSLKAMKKYTWVWLTLGSICGLIPDQRSLAVIYIVPKIVNSEAMQQVGQDTKALYDMAIERMKELLAKPEPPKEVANA